MKHIKVTITAVDSLVITASSGNSVLTPSGDYISGTMLRGIFAGEYIREKKLGTEAHKDKDFKRLFFENVNFVDAMPSHNGVASFPVPFSVMKDKASNKLMDMLKEDKPRPGYKNVRGLAVVEDNKLCSISVNKNILFHMSRSSEQERISGRSSDGQIFNYESIDPGQQFVGEIIGGEDDLAQLLSGMPSDGFTAHVGRSRFAQYGTVQVQLGKIEDIHHLNTPTGKELFIRALTPLIPSTGIITSADQAIMEMCGNILDGIKVSKVFASVVAIDNFVNIWGMKRPRVNALGAGTVFVLEKDEWTAEDLRKVESAMFGGIGQRTQEGFGQLRGWQADVYEKGSDVLCIAGNQGDDILISGMAKDITARVVEKFVLEQLKQYAYDDAVNLKSSIKGKTHLFARLLQELGNEPHDNIRQMFGETVEKTLNERKHSPYAKALKLISVNGNHFEDLFTDFSCKMPYIDKWNETMSRSDLKMKDLLNKIDMQISDEEISNGKYFHDYWYWLFHYCRKLSARKKEAR